MSKYFYKILEQAPSLPLPEKLPTTDLDAQDGFIHLSTAKQIPVTADLFFSKSSTIHLLKLRASDLDGSIQYVEAAGPGCPHLHDSQHGLGKHNVEDVLSIERGQRAKWADVPSLRELED